MITNTGYNSLLTAQQQQFHVEDFYNQASGVNRTSFLRNGTTTLQPSGLVISQSPQIAALAHQQQQHHQVQLNQHQLQTPSSLAQQNGGILIVANSELAKYNELFSHWKDYRLDHLKVYLKDFLKKTF